MHQTAIYRLSLWKFLGYSKLRKRVQKRSKERNQNRGNFFIVWKCYNKELLFCEIMNKKFKVECLSGNTVFDRWRITALKNGVLCSRTKKVTLKHNNELPVCGRKLVSSVKNFVKEDGFAESCWKFQFHSDKKLKYCQILNAFLSLSNHSSQLKWIKYLS